MHQPANASAGQLVEKRGEFEEANNRILSWCRYPKDDIVAGPEIGDLVRIRRGARGQRTRLLDTFIQHVNYPCHDGA